MHTTLTILLALALLIVGPAAWFSRRHRLRAERLADAAHQQLRQLNERLVGVERRRSELEAVLSSMIEGVIAIDTEERLISLNRAAASLLALDPEKAIGRSLPEVVRNTTLHSLVADALQVNLPQPAAGELTFRHDPGSSTDDLHLQAQAAPVLDTNGQQFGVVVVLHDITRLRRLEAVRRDFVANVSHEIKTPISAIKAAVETLADPRGLPDADRERFTGIIARQADRLDNIIEDLLSLTRLEQADEDDRGLDLEPYPLRPVVTAAIETCSANAAAKSISLETDLEPLTARIIPNLLEQALVNLIDNAVKYSPEHTVVTIRTRTQGKHAVISVTDQGRGIEPEHLPRIFERFYRTDRARSRQLGGTGLGLSIVKHVAESHGGRAGVQSQIGAGSTFSLYLQAAEPVTA